MSLHFPRAQAVLSDEETPDVITTPPAEPEVEETQAEKPSDPTLPVPDSSSPP